MKLSYKSSIPYLADMLREQLCSMIGWLFFLQIALRDQKVLGAFEKTPP